MVNIRRFFFLKNTYNRRILWRYFPLKLCILGWEQVWSFLYSSCSKKYFHGDYVLTKNSTFLKLTEAEFRGKIIVIYSFFLWFIFHSLFTQCKKKLSPFITIYKKKYISTSKIRKNTFSNTEKLNFVFFHWKKHTTELIFLFVIFFKIAK